MSFTPLESRRADIGKSNTFNLNSRNDYLKERCRIGFSLPAELQGEFNEWKSECFKTGSPKLAAFLEKAKNSGNLDSFKELFSSAEGLCRFQGFSVHSLEMGQTDRKALDSHINQARWIDFIESMIYQYFIPLTPLFFEWLKGEDWARIKQFVEQEVSTFPDKAKKDFLMMCSMWSDNAGVEYYSASAAYFKVITLREKLQSCAIGHTDDLDGYWNAVESAWRGSSREYERLKLQEHETLSMFEQLENRCTGSNNRENSDKVMNIYQPVHVKLNALDFLIKFRNKEFTHVNDKLCELGIEDPESINETHLEQFENHFKVYTILVIKVFASKVERASFSEITQMLKELKDEFKKLTLELFSLEECKKLVSKIRQNKCFINDDGKVTCTSARWNERLRDSKWAGYVLFKPTKPYNTYLAHLLWREQALRHRYGVRAIISHFIEKNMILKNPVSISTATNFKIK